MLPSLFPGVVWATGWARDNPCKRLCLWPPLFQRAKELSNVNVRYSTSVCLGAREQSQAHLMDSNNCRPCVPTKCWANGGIYPFWFFQPQQGNEQQQHTWWIFYNAGLWKYLWLSAAPTVVVVRDSKNNLSQEKVQQMGLGFNIVFNWEDNFTLKAGLGWEKHGLLPGCIIDSQGDFEPNTSVFRSE